MPNYFPPALVVTLKFDIKALYYALYDDAIHENPSAQYTPGDTQLDYYVWSTADYYIESLTRAIENRTPVFTGNLRGSVNSRPRTCETAEMWHWTSPVIPTIDYDAQGHEIIVGHTQSYGDVTRYVTITQAIDNQMSPTNPFSYALPVELGSSPHTPPVLAINDRHNSLSYWAESHGMSPWFLQKHVARHGHPEGAYMYADTVLIDLPMIVVASPFLYASSAGFVIPEKEFAVQYSSGSYSGRTVHYYSDLHIQVINLGVNFLP